MAKEVTKNPQMMVSHDREDDLPTVSGQQPAGMLADDILSGRVTVLIVEASNPLLACGNPRRPPRAGAREARAAGEHRSVPERGREPRAFRPPRDELARAARRSPTRCRASRAAIRRPYMIYADAVLEPPPGVRPEWWMYTRLADELGVTLFGNRLASGAAKVAARLASSRLGRAARRSRPADRRHAAEGRPSRAKKMAREHPHGILLPEHRGGDFLGTDRVLSQGRQGRPRAGSRSSRASTPRPRRSTRTSSRHADRVKLVGKREMRRMNTSSRELGGTGHRDDELRLREPGRRDADRRRERRSRRGRVGVRADPHPGARHRRDDAAHDRDPAVLGTREGRRLVARAHVTRASTPTCSPATARRPSSRSPACRICPGSGWR